eukprot:CAMPEP_0181253490 /NCGR_PEP_ID=MMETSP1096-20121128/48039_1 /TAXON_ID=156174 ORGANISM="Chrysochromulina ericina, Strain CCMP281" /NCGR_SAMPLE_ID=MMETSP1096 /ASSEMBLY_ACC=CAM_ASM_000453 /LENGTH=118 /DNA_ID=CAMNT_0023351345 /DNA_START=740 /DNA_END=1096 /DNA_ORIENTATION=+
MTGRQRTEGKLAASSDLVSHVLVYVGVVDSVAVATTDGHWFEGEHAADELAARHKQDATVELAWAHHRRRPSMLYPLEPGRGSTCTGWAGERGLKADVVAPFHVRGGERVPQQDDIAI